MNLGTLIDALEDEGYAAGALDAIGDVVLLAQVHAMREAHDETPGEYVANASRRFASRASDEDWLSLMNTMERADTPGRAAIAHMVQWAVTADAAERDAGVAPHGDPADGGCGGRRFGCGTR
jgi:hypothetical protein